MPNHRLGTAKPIDSPRKPMTSLLLPPEFQVKKSPLAFNAHEVYFPLLFCGCRSRSWVTCCRIRGPRSWNVHFLITPPTNGGYCERHSHRTRSCISPRTTMATGLVNYISLKQCLLDPLVVATLTISAIATRSHSGLTPTIIVILFTLKNTLTLSSVRTAR